MVNINDTTPQTKLLRVWADAHVSRDLNNAASTFSKDFTVKMYPQDPAFPDLTKEEYLHRYNAAIPLFSKVDVVFHEVIEAPGKIVAHLTIFFTSADGTTVEWDTVNILSFVDEGGELKIIETKDFCDPEKRAKFHAEAAKLMGMPVA